MVGFQDVMRKYKASVSAVTTDQITIQVTSMDHNDYDADNADNADDADDDGDDGNDVTTEEITIQVTSITSLHFVGGYILDLIHLITF